MNREEYIASGILEQYAMGLCNDAERREVEAAIAADAALRAELSYIEDSLFQYAAANAVEPSAKVRGNVLAAIAEEKKETPIVPLNATRKFNWLAAASIVLLLGSLAGNYMLYDKYTSTNARVLALENENSVFANDLNIERAKYSQASSMLAMINDPSTTLVELKGLENSPESKATIFWNQQSTEVYMSVASLPAAPDGMQYQLWAIVDGAPVDAGMIALDALSNMPHKMKDFASVQAFAVTLEKKGGSPIPSMDKMYVIGTVPS